MELALRVPRITGDLDGHRKGYNTEKRDEKKRRLYGGQDRSSRCGGRVVVEGRRRGERESEDGDGKNEGEGAEGAGGVIWSEGWVACAQRDGE